MEIKAKPAIVKWVDCRHYGQDWFSHQDLVDSTSLAYIETIGWILEKDDRVIVYQENYPKTHDWANGVGVRRVMAIPKVDIKEIVFLEERKKNVK